MGSSVLVWVAYFLLYSCLIFFLVDIGDRMDIVPIVDGKYPLNCESWKDESQHVLLKNLDKCSLFCQRELSANQF